MLKVGARGVPTFVDSRACAYVRSESEAPRQIEVFTGTGRRAGRESGMCARSSKKCMTLDVQCSCFGGRMPFKIAASDCYFSSLISQVSLTVVSAIDLYKLSV